MESQQEFGRVPPGFAQYSLPGIMHWLQMEWLRFEREQLAWHVERCELQTRVSILEGEKRSLQTLQTDLTRRLKMLEATLKQERAKNGVFEEHAPTLSPPDARAKEDVPRIADEHHERRVAGGYGTLRSREIIRAFLEESEALVAFHIPSNSLVTASVPAAVAPEKAPEEKVVNPRAMFGRPAAPQRRRLDPAGQPTQQQVIRIQKRSRDGMEENEMQKLKEAEQDLEHIEKLMAEHSMTGDSDTIVGKPSLLAESLEPSLLADSLKPRWKWSNWFGLSHHLDAIRSVAWTKDTILFSASEDGTAKMWNVSSLINAPRVPTDVEPIFTFRGHVQAVTSLAVAEFTNKSLLVTGSLDSTIRTWQVPSSTQDPYAPYQVSTRALVGHSDAVWHVAVQQPVAPGKPAMISSASADGTVKIWQLMENGEGILKFSLQSLSIPTNVQWLNQVVLAGYKNGNVVLWDIETASELATIATGGAQINSISCHPTIENLALTSGEDGKVHLLDLEHFTVMTSIQAHDDGVPCVDFWHTGDLFLTTSHDGTCKVWDTTTRTLLTIASSPRRLDQGAWTGSFFPSSSKTPGPNFCFAGAEGILHVVKAE